MIWDVAKGAGDDNAQQLSETDLAIIGTSKRLSIPLGEPLLMRQVADVLRALAMQLDMSSRRTDMEERQRRMYDRFEIDSAGRKIKEAASSFGLGIREGRPPGSRTDD